MNYPSSVVILDYEKTVQTLKGPMRIELHAENSRIKTRCEFCNQSLLVHNLKSHQSKSQACLKRQRQSCSGDGENNRITDDTNANVSQPSSFPENKPTKVNVIEDNDKTDNII